MQKQQQMHLELIPTKSPQSASHGNSQRAFTPSECNFTATENIFAQIEKKDFYHVAHNVFNIQISKHFVQNKSTGPSLHRNATFIHPLKLS